MLSLPCLIPRTPVLDLRPSASEGAPGPAALPASKPDGARGAGTSAHSNLAPIRSLDLGTRSLSMGEVVDPATGVKFPLLQTFW